MQDPLKLSLSRKHDLQTTLVRRQSAFRIDAAAALKQIGARIFGFQN